MTLFTLEPKPRTGDTRVVRRNAWLPVTLYDGRTIWLRRYWSLERRYWPSGGGKCLGWWFAEAHADRQDAAHEAIRMASAAGATFYGDGVKATYLPGVWR